MNLGSLSRRRFLAMNGAAAAGLVVAGCGGTVGRRPPVGPSDEAVAIAERSRRRSGAPVREFAITAGSARVDLGGLNATTWAYGSSVPGGEIRVRAGEVVRARFTNDLPEATTIHWHGVALRNDMDGVPEVTQPPVAPGATFTYDFAVPDPGTYWFHPHSGLQLDRGLYAPLVIEDLAEPGGYDREYVVVLDDWTDGLGQSPEESLDQLRRGEGPHAAHLGEGAGGGPRSDLLDSPGGDVSYPLYLLNGRRPSAPVTFDAAPGERLRLRIVNAAADTPFRVAIGGHRMTVTHADGFPVDPVTVDALMIGMAERYDVLVTVGQGGATPLVAVAEAKGAQAMAVIRSGPGDVPRPDIRPAELRGRVLQLSELRAAQSVRLPAGDPDLLFVVELGGGEEGYVWTINGRPHGHDQPLEIQQGQRVRLAFNNRTTMFHPMHLHGHTFQVVLPSGQPGARKDTAIIRPDQRLAVDFVADNPGQWMLHCHNLYHQQGGMMTTVSYVNDRRSGQGRNEELAARWRLACEWLGASGG
ncbi:MAG: multicopper oxidase family protein [Acidimicrobiales bacterium]